MLRDFMGDELPASCQWNDQPVYIGLPTDLSDYKALAGRLERLHDRKKELG